MFLIYYLILIGSAGKQRKVRQLLPGDMKGWVIGTELDREGFKHLMHIELRRLGDFLIEILKGGGSWCRWVE